MLLVYALIGIWTGDRFAERLYGQAALSLAIGMLIAFQVGMG